MAYTKSADGMAKKGKTEGKNLGDSGPVVKEIKGGTKSAGVTSMDMKKFGRNMARVMNQKSSGRGR